jgi:hypothetical protein
MSAEYKTMMSLKVVTDHDCDSYKLGEVSGAFDDVELKEYIRDYGPTALINALARLQHQVIKAKIEVLQLNIFEAKS